MTPEQLKAAEVTLGSPLGVNAYTAKRLGLRLLAEVKLLREALEWSRTRLGRAYSKEPSGDLPQAVVEVRDAIGEFLDEEDPTP